MGDGTRCERLTYCGDNTRQGSEQCDGLDLGDATCTRFGFDSGALACSVSCMFETSGCARAPAAGAGGRSGPVTGGAGGSGGAGGAAGSGGRPGGAGGASGAPFGAPSATSTFDHCYKPEVAPGGYGIQVDRPPPFF